MRRVRMNRMELLRRMTSIPSLPICRSASAIALLQMWESSAGETGCSGKTTYEQWQHSSSACTIHQK